MACNSLARSGELLRAVADGINDAVFVKNLDGRYVFMNRAGSSFIGLRSEEIVGRRTEDLFDAATTKSILASSRAMLASGEAMKFEYELNGAPGKRVYLSTKAPYRDSAGRLVGILGICCDITDRKRVEAELLRSHQALSDVLESITDGFYACDDRWRITYVNRRARELLRLSTADVGRSIWDFAPDAVGTVFQAQYERVLRERVSVSFEAPYRGKWWEVHAYPKAGGGVCICFRDVSDRKRATLALTESETRYRLVARATSDVIYDCDLKTGVVHCNLAVEGLLLYRQADVGQTFEWWQERIHPLERGRVEASFAAAVAGRGDSWCEEYRFQKGDGAYAEILDRAYIVRDAAGGARRVIGAMQDLTDRKRAARVEEERNGLRTAVGAMERVLGVVGHELRTPLAGLRAMVELLMDLPGDSEESGSFLTGIHGEVIRMSQMVNDLLEVARLNSGIARWNWSTYAVKQACEQAADSIRPLIDGEKVELRVAAIPVEMTAAGDGEAIRRLVLNLLSNAYRHTSAGRIEVGASSHADASGRWVKIEVRDTGEGMTPEIAAKLGEAFALNLGVVDDHAHGSGLGLSICKGIVAAHGGRIDVRSRLGRGTTITAWLRADLCGPSEAQGSISFTPVAGVPAA